MKRILLFIFCIAPLHADSSPFAALIGGFAQAATEKTASGLATAMLAQEGAMMKATQVMAQGAGAQQDLMQKGAQAAMVGMAAKQNLLAQGMQAKEQMNQQLNGPAVQREQAFVEQKAKTEAAKEALFSFLDEALSAGGDEVLAVFEGESIEQTGVELIERCVKFKELSAAFVAEQEALFIVLDTHIGLPAGHVEPPIQPSIASQPLENLLSDASSTGGELMEVYNGDEEEGGYLRMIAVAAKALKMVEREEVGLSDGKWSFAASYLKNYAQNNARIMPSSDYAALKAQVRQAGHELLSFSHKVLFGGVHAVLARRQEAAQAKLITFIDKAFAQDYAEEDDFDEEDEEVVAVPVEPRARFSLYTALTVEFKTADMSYWALGNAAFGRTWQAASAAVKKEDGAGSEASIAEPLTYEQAKALVVSSLPAIKESVAQNITIYPTTEALADQYVMQRNEVSRGIRAILAVSKEKLESEAEAAPVVPEDAAAGDTDSVDEGAVDAQAVVVPSDDDGYEADDEAEFDYDGDFGLGDDW